MNEGKREIALRVSIDQPYEQAVETVTSALMEEGFGVLSEIDVKATLKEKLDADFRKYVILGACNPHLAHQALHFELEVGLLLPCNVIVYERQDSSVVSIVDPIPLLGILENEEVHGVAEKARQKLMRVLDKLSADSAR